MTSKRATDAKQYREDLELMTLAASGDRQAQATVLRRVLPRVRVLAASMMRHPQDAEDAVQASLMAVLNGAGSFRGESKLETWADRVATCATLNHARKRRVRAVRETAGELDAMATELPPVVEHALPRSLREYLDELPEARRTALVLHHVLGHTVDEIAELTDTPRDTIKSRLTQAREDLKKLIRREQAIGRPTRGEADG